MWAFSVHTRFGGLQWDLEAYMAAAGAVWRGETPYLISTPDPNGFNETVLTVYVYPPLFARILSPLSLIDIVWVRIGWLALQALAFESLYWLGLRLFGFAFGPLSWLLFHYLGVRYDGVFTDFRAGNTALMEASLLTAWMWIHLKREPLSGLLLAFLCAIKPFTVFMALWDTARQRWKPVAVFAATGAVLLGIMLADSDHVARYREFLDSETFQRIMEEHTVGIYNNATVSVAFRCFTDQTFFKPFLLYPPLAYAMTFAVPIAVWVLFFSAMRGLAAAGVSNEEMHRRALVLLLPTVLLTIPRVADYTLVWLYVPLFFGAWESWKSGRRGLFALYVAAGIMGNLPIRPSQLADMTYSYHLLHYRYVSLVMFWLAGWMAARPPQKASD